MELTGHFLYMFRSRHRLVKMHRWARCGLWATACRIPALHLYI